MTNTTPRIASELDMSAFLASALGAGQFQLHPLAGDASARRYFRVVAHDESFVLMQWEPFVDDGRYPFLNVRQHFERHGVQVPSVIALKPEFGLVLLEDLGDLTLERKFWESQSTSHSLIYYEATIDELLKIHYDCTLDRGNCVAFGVEFDVAKLLWEMNYGRQHLLHGLAHLTLSEQEESCLSENFQKICERIAAEPKFIAHRDYHSRNVMIKLGKVRVIDFQDARLGAIQYDLVSLLRDSYVNLDEETARRLIDRYIDGRDQKARSYDGRLLDLSLEKFDLIYEVQTVQRCFKACGSFASFYMLRKDTRYLKYLPQTLRTVRSALQKLPEYSGFLSVLEDRGVFDRDFAKEIAQSQETP
jgi:aminoglycoside/choline kinase family phosphotransferase